MSYLNELSSLYYKVFATDQNFYLQQQEEGHYNKKPAYINKSFSEEKIKARESFGFYQRNKKNRVKWICYDFDILKKNIGTDKYNDSELELSTKVKDFTEKLKLFGIPYLMEFSGNRGYHIWITFKEDVEYRVSYDILHTIWQKSSVVLDHSLVDVDFYPKNKSLSSGVGLGVKVPLSLHRKSNNYSYLLEEYLPINKIPKIDILSEEIYLTQLSILQNHRDLCVKDLEKEFQLVFDIFYNEHNYSKKIKEIIISKKFDINQLFIHWNKTNFLKVLIKKIKDDNFTHDIRLILVGILKNIKLEGKDTFSNDILHEIFKISENYDKDKTNYAIDSLASFNFPSKEQLTSILNYDFDKKEYSTEMLLQKIVPNFVSFKDGRFSISKNDIIKASKAELTYLFQNDEVISKKIINKLSIVDSTKLLEDLEYLKFNISEIKYFSHLRNEPKTKDGEDKVRTLFTLDFKERLLSTIIIQQIDFFLNYKISDNSFGYIFNKNLMEDGSYYIFKPWLNSWVKYLNEVNLILEDDDYEGYSIIKTDVSNFYGSISHDKLTKIMDGDLNPGIKKIINDEENQTVEVYRDMIKVLINLSTKLLGSSLGLPQGPAYARYLAEMYLSPIDNYFDEEVNKTNILLYKRYVDDIFIIVEDHSQAEEILKTLKNNLDTLGLKLNSEKTKISEVKNFRDEFDEYRSQSKYVVDQVLKKFSYSNESEKDNAISEFINLIDGDNIENDLAFIFSHPNDDEYINERKKELVEPTLQNKVARGSLYKHLFNFILEDKSNWLLVDNIKEFDELQSEVLTTCIISILEVTKANLSELNEFILGLLKKIKNTDFTKENLAYMKINFNLGIDIYSIEEKFYIENIMYSTNKEDIYIDDKLFNHINTNINYIKDTYSFIEVAYTISISFTSNKEILDRISDLFFTRLSFDRVNDVLYKNNKPVLNTPLIAKKYYYLLCMFSISSSSQNSSDLLHFLWKYCIEIFNLIYLYNSSYLLNDWLKKIEYITVSPEKINLIVSSIVEGSFVSEISDKKNIFEKFHNSLLIYFALEKKIYIFDNEEVKNTLNKLKEKSNFYKWIVDNSDVSIFPSNKQWFENNIISNNTISLKKKNEILIRKIDNSNSSSDYIEYIQPYNSNELISVRNIIKDFSLKEFFNFLVKFSRENESFFPNVFTKENFINKTTYKCFSEEFGNTDYLLYEGEDNIIEKKRNNHKNFIYYLFQTFQMVKKDDSFRIIYEKYIQNLKGVDLFSFLNILVTELNKMDINDHDEFSFDLLIASSIYNCINEENILRKIKIFISQYHNFHRENEKKHIYIVNNNLNISAINAECFFNSLISSFSLITKEIIPTSNFLIVNDLKSLLDNLNIILNKISDEFKSKDLVCKSLKVYLKKKTVSYDNKRINFRNIKFIDLYTKSIEEFDTRHYHVVNSADNYTYLFEDENDVVLLAIPNFLITMYENIYEESRLLSEHKHKNYIDIKHKLNNNLSHFNESIDLISKHNYINDTESEKILNSWLNIFPFEVRQELLYLISAHEVMTQTDLDEFLKVYDILINNRKEENPFLIKELKDMNGTHRILLDFDKSYKRNIGNITPDKIDKDSKKICIIVDCILSGTQLNEALRYYLGVEKESNSYYFPNDEMLISKLKNLETVNICTLLYTEEGLAKVSNTLKCNISKDIKVNILCGRKINNNFNFEKTVKIGIKNKEKIIELLTNKDKMNCIYDQLNSKSINLDKEIINETNLVMRYKSMPKRSFSLLYEIPKNILIKAPCVREKERYEK